MTKKVMSLLIVACVAMSMIGVTIGVVAYRKNKSETPAVHSLNAETAVDRAGVEKYSVNFNDFNPTDKRSYEIVPAGDLDVNLEFTKGKGKLAEVVYVTIRYGANEKNEKTELLKDVYGKNFELGKNVGNIEIIFEFRTANERNDNRDDNEYMGATADFVLKITSKTVEEAK